MTRHDGPPISWGQHSHDGGRTWHSHPIGEHDERPGHPCHPEGDHAT